MKGQVTIFIIIGLLILLLAAAAIYLRQSQNTQQYTSVSAPTLSDVPIEVLPVREFMHSCMQTLTEDAIRLAGEHGGYVRTTSLHPSQKNPTDTNAVYLIDDTSPVAYWWNMDSSNTCTNCTFRRGQPQLSGAKDSIEEQIATYVQEELPNCLQNFETLSHITVQPNGEIAAQARIGTETVILSVAYPLIAKANKNSYNINDFAITIPVNLPEIYNLATTLTTLEEKHAFLEKDVANILTAFSAKDPNALPPFSSVSVGLDAGTYWILGDVQTKVQQILSAYIPLLQVWGTQNYKYISTPKNIRDTRDPKLFDLTYNRQQLIPIEEQHPQVSATFSYLDWKPYFHLNCNGAICGPQAFTNTFGFTFGIQQYAFAYDISIPVMVELRNPSAFAGRNGGFAFRFMLETNLRDNKPIDLSSGKGLQGKTGQGSKVSFPSRGSMLCDQAQRTSAPVNITVRDANTKKPINALISFSCGIEKCLIDSTTNGSLNAKFPVCFGGAVTATSQAHDFGHVALSTSTEKSSSITLQLAPYTTLPVTVQRYFIRKGQTGWNPVFTNPAPHGANDQTIITLARRESDASVQAGEQYSTVVEVEGDIFNTNAGKSANAITNSNVAAKPHIQLLPGSYDVTITTISTDEMKILPHTTCYGGGNSSCIRMPNSTITFGPELPFAAGTSTFTWTVTQDELKNAKEITFFTLYHALAQVPEVERTLEDITINTQDFVVQHEQELQPAIK